MNHLTIGLKDHGKTTLLKALAAGTLLVLAGCMIQLSPPDSKLLDPNGQFTLYVSNQSNAVSPVDIQIEIDGEVVVHEYFETGDQHTWKAFTLNLPAGVHQLRVSSTRGDTEFSKEFEVTGEHWAKVEYWYYPELIRGGPPTPRQFIFLIKDEPIDFM